MKVTDAVALSLVAFAIVYGTSIGSCASQKASVTNHSTAAATSTAAASARASVDIRLACCPCEEISYEE